MSGDTKVGERTQRIRERQAGAQSATPGDIAAAIARGDYTACDSHADHVHRADVSTSKPGSGLYKERCRCGATRTADYRGLVGELVEPKRSAWKASRAKSPLAALAGAEPPTADEAARIDREARGSIADRAKAYQSRAARADAKVSDEATSAEDKRTPLSAEEIGATRAHAVMALHYEDNSASTADNQSRRVLRLLVEQADLRAKLEAAEREAKRQIYSLAADNTRLDLRCGALEDERRIAHFALDGDGYALVESVIAYLRSTGNMAEALHRLSAGVASTSARPRATLKRARAERDAAIARAEAAERERDALRARFERERGSLVEHHGLVVRDIERNIRGVRLKLEDTYDADGSHAVAIACSSLLRLSNSLSEHFGKPSGEGGAGHE